MCGNSGLLVGQISGLIVNEDDNFRDAGNESETTKCYVEL
jgi:hypothetical protein